MLGIIIPLKSKKVSENWQITSDLLYQTILSILGQTSYEYKIIVVGHEKPELPIEYPFIECPLPLPIWDYVQDPITHYKQIDYILDKTRKISLGLQYFSSDKVDYYYVLDADDILHKTLVSYIHQINSPNGYILKLGYEYYINKKKILLRNDIEKRCGSTTILHKSLVSIPKSLQDSDVWSHPWGQISHGDMEKYFHEKKRSLYHIHFPFLLYTLNHGQNASNEFRKGWKTKTKQMLKELIYSKPISDSVKETFSLV
jgi:hypothetical protein